MPSCGKNFNIPLNKTGLGDEDYLSIFHQILLPVTHEFRPDLILVSAGYDAAIGKSNFQFKISPLDGDHPQNAQWPKNELNLTFFLPLIGCPEGQMKVTPAAYGHLIHSLMSFAEGRVGVFLEGGKKIP